MLAARALKRRRHRDEASAYLIEGVTSVLDAIAANVDIVDIFVDDESEGAAEVRPAADAAGLDVTPVTPGIVKAIADTSTPQGVVCVARAPLSSLESLPPDLELVLILTSVRDPGNAGTLLRSALGAGASAAIFTSGSVDPYASKTVRAAAGALWRLPIVREVPVEEAVAYLRAAGLKTLGADAKAPTSIEDVDLSGPVAFVMGNEAWGLDDEVRDLVDEIVSIPMPGPVESLNVAIAGSILLFECARRRRLSST